MYATVVQEFRPYRFICDEAGRYAVIEVRCGHVYCLDCDHPRHEAEDTPEGMAKVVGAHGWGDYDGALKLFRLMVDSEERYGQILW
ncbi:MAG: hypothetical protein ACM31L_11730 [Actinomycetota bacterium]